MTIASTVEQFDTSAQTNFKDTIATVLVSGGLSGVTASNIRIDSITAGSIVVKWSLVGVSSTQETALTTNAQQIFTSTAAKENLQQIGVTSLNLPGVVGALGTAIVPCTAATCVAKTYDNPGARAVHPVSTAHPALLRTSTPEHPLAEFLKPNALRGGRRLLETVSSPNPTKVTVKFKINGNAAATNKLVTLVKTGSKALKQDLNVVAASYGGTVPVYPTVLPSGSFAGVYAGDNNFAAFTPPTSGNYSFMVSYEDKCGLAYRNVVIAAVCSKLIPALPKMHYDTEVNRNFTLVNMVNSTTNQTFSYKWCLISAPAGSNLTQTEQRNAVFHAGPNEGEAEVRLTVGDGCTQKSTTYTVNITCGCPPTTMVAAQHLITPKGDELGGSVDLYAHTVYLQEPMYTRNLTTQWSMVTQKLTAGDWGLAIYKNLGAGMSKWDFEQDNNVRKYTLLIKRKMETMSMPGPSYMSPMTTNTTSNSEIYPRPYATPLPSTSAMVQYNQTHYMNTQWMNTSMTTTMVEEWEEWCQVTISNWQHQNATVAVNSYAMCMGELQMQANVKVGGGCPFKADIYTLSVGCAEPPSVACSCETDQVIWNDPANFSVVAASAYPTGRPGFPYFNSPFNQSVQIEWSILSNPTIPYPWATGARSLWAPSRAGMVLLNETYAFLWPNWHGQYKLRVQVNTNCWAASEYTIVNAACRRTLPQTSITASGGGSLSYVGGTFGKIMMNWTNTATVPSPINKADFGTVKFAQWLKPASSTTPFKLFPISTATNLSFTPVFRSIRCLASDASDSRYGDLCANGVDIPDTSGSGTTSTQVMFSTSEGCQIAPELTPVSFSTSCPTLTATILPTTVTKQQMHSCNLLTCNNYYTSTMLSGNGTTVTGVNNSLLWFVWNSSAAALANPKSLRATQYAPTPGKVDNFTYTISNTENKVVVTLAVSDGCSVATNMVTITPMCTSKSGGLLNTAISGTPVASPLDFDLYTNTIWPVLLDGGVAVQNQNLLHSTLNYMNGVYSFSSGGCNGEAFFYGNWMSLVMEGSACETQYYGMKEGYYQAIIQFKDEGLNPTTQRFSATFAKPAGMGPRWGLWQKDNSNIQMALGNTSYPDQYNRANQTNIQLNRNTISSTTAQYLGTWNASKVTLNSTVTDCSVQVNLFNRLFTMSVWGCTGSASPPQGFYAGRLDGDCYSTNGCILRYVEGPAGSYPSASYFRTMNGTSPMYQRFKLTASTVISNTNFPNGPGTLTFYQSTSTTAVPNPFVPAVASFTAEFNPPVYWGLPTSSSINPEVNGSPLTDLQKNAWFGRTSSSGCMNAWLFWGRAFMSSSNCSAAAVQFVAGQYSFNVHTSSYPRKVYLAVTPGTGSVAATATAVWTTFQYDTAASCETTGWTNFLVGTTFTNTPPSSFPAFTGSMSEMMRYVGPRYFTNWAWQQVGSTTGGSPTITNANCMTAKMTPNPNNQGQTYRFRTTANAGLATDCVAQGDLTFMPKCQIHFPQTSSSPTTTTPMTVTYSYNSASFPTADLVAHTVTYTGLNPYTWYVLSSPWGSNWGRTMTTGPTMSANTVSTTSVVNPGITKMSMMNMNRTHPTPASVSSVAINAFQVWVPANLTVRRNMTTTTVTMTTHNSTMGSTDLAVLKSTVEKSCFTPDIQGQYSIQSKAVSPCGQTHAQTFVVNAKCPEGNAGPHLSPAAPSGIVVTMPPNLDLTATRWGRIQMDVSNTLKLPNMANGKPISVGLRWFVTKPGTNTTINVNVANPNGMIASFVPFGTGSYNITLLVDDGCRVQAFSHVYTAQCSGPRADPLATLSKEVVFAEGTDNRFSTVYISRKINPLLETCLGKATVTYLGRVCNEPRHIPVAPPPPPAPVPQAVCQTKMFGYWWLTSKPCDSKHVIGNITMPKYLNEGLLSNTSLDETIKVNWGIHNTTYNFVPDAPGVYTLSLYLWNGCARVEKNVTINALCNRKLTAQANDVTVLFGCNNASAILKGSVQQEQINYMPATSCPLAAKPSITYETCLKDNTKYGTEVDGDCCPPCTCEGICCRSCTALCGTKHSTVVTGCEAIAKPANNTPATPPPAPQPAPPQPGPAPAPTTAAAATVATTAAAAGTTAAAAATTAAAAATTLAATTAAATTAAAAATTAAATTAAGRAAELALLSAEALHSDADAVAAAALAADRRRYTGGVVSPGRLRAHIQSANAEPVPVRMPAHLQSSAQPASSTGATVNGGDKGKVTTRGDPILVITNVSGVEMRELKEDPKDKYPLKPPGSFIGVITVVCILLVASIAVNVFVYRKVKGMGAGGSIDMRGVELSNAPNFSSRA